MLETRLQLKKPVRIHLREESLIRLFLRALNPKMEVFHRAAVSETVLNRSARHADSVSTWILSAKDTRRRLHCKMPEYRASVFLFRRFLPTALCG